MRGLEDGMVSEGRGPDPKRLLLVTFVTYACVTICILALGTSAAGAKRTPARLRQVALHARFHRADTGVTSLLADGRHVFLSGPVAADATQGGVLIDDQTGRRTPISADTGCSSPVIGGPWLSFAACPDPLQLDPVAGGLARTVSRPRVGDAPVALGRDWIEYRSNCDDVHVCPSYAFQNISTGMVRRDPTDASTIANLNSPKLAHRVCRGLTVPTGDFLAPPTEWLVFDGNVALADDPSGIVLRQCKRTLHLATHASPGHIGASSRAIVWQQGNKLAGVLLPSLRRFTLGLPAIGLYTLALGPRTLYILDPEGQLWTIPAAALANRH